MFSPPQFFRNCTALGKEKKVSKSSFGFLYAAKKVFFEYWFCLSSSFICGFAWMRFISSSRLFSAAVERISSESRPAAAICSDLLWSALSVTQKINAIVKFDAKSK